MTDVEIFWPATVSTDALFDAETVLRDAGIDTTTKLQPGRRGPELSVLVFVATTAIEPMLKALFQRVGDGAFGTLRDFVTKLLGEDKPDTEPTPRSVLFRSATSGAQFVFTSNLPEEAYRQAVTLDPGTAPGNWVWDHGSHSWLQFRDSAST